jgi:hypothetical protein
MKTEDRMVTAAQLTAAQLKDALAGVESFAQLLRIPATAIDDVFRDGLARLRALIDTHPYILDAVVLFLNWVPVFGDCDGDDCCEGVEEPAIDTLCSWNVYDFLSRCRSLGNYRA